jgi:membrane protein implicated in regulation of membrane protease activity
LERRRPRAAAPVTIAAVHDWIFWSIVAVVLAVGEWLTPGAIVLAPAALGAVVATVLAAAGSGWVIQLLVFAGGALASYVRARYRVRR